MLMMLYASIWCNKAGADLVNWGPQYLHVKLEKHIAFNWKRKAQLLSAARGTEKMQSERERERGVRALGKRDLALSR